MKIKPQLHSLGLVDSQIDLESMKLICNVLEESSLGKKNSDVRINFLNFSFCYLSQKVFNQLLQSIGMNNTLINLNLSNNKLGNQGCGKLCKVLQSNISLLNLNIAGNLLTDDFGFDLS